MNYSEIKSRFSILPSISGRFAAQATHFKFSKSLKCFFFIQQSVIYRIDVPCTSDSIEKSIKAVVLPTDLLQKSNTTSGNLKLTKEEELLRERQRGATNTNVISSFNLHPDGDKMIIPALRTLFYVAFDKDNVKIKKLSAEHDPSSVRMDVQWSPDGKLISFVRKNNLWVYNIQEEKEFKLTNIPEDETSTISVTPDFVMQEEFDRFSGTGWAPVTQHYRMIYLQVDVSPVSELALPTSQFSEPDSEKHRFARPGQKNALEEVFVIDFDAHGKVTQKLETSKPIRELFPNIEYIVRFFWPVDGQALYLQLLDRRQKKLHWVESKLTSGSLQFSQFHCDQSDIWINLSDIFYPLKSGGFIFSSEDNAEKFRHLKLYKPNIPPLQLTSGEWQVDDLLAVDEEAGLLYFTSSKDSPIQFHLYQLNFSDAQKPTTKLLTDTKYSHSSVVVGIPATGEFCASFSYSNHRTEPKKGFLFGVNQPVINFPFQPPTPLQPIIFPEIFTFQNSINKLSYGLLFKPPNFDPSQKYPTILYVYGGPHVQLIVDDYTSVISRFPKFQVWLYLGYQVVVIDGPGSWRRGLEWESCLQSKMGKVELETQVLGLKSLPSVDQKRICVTGWSYGGYMSLLALIQYPEVFRIAVSGAPVTFWEAYDTGYTERYMGYPPDDQEAYHNSSVLENADKFPDEEGRLLLVHGLKDENVHFTHTSELIRKLTLHGKPYDIQVYPDERHGIRDWNSFLHFETKFASYIRKL